MQSRRWSLIEAVTSTLVGFLASWALQTLLAFAYNKHFTTSENLQWVVFFTLLSLLRGYGLRRFFNWLGSKAQK